ncbi:LOW QUALITY PROTEIN: 2-oxoglutarate receptor 1-like [Phaethornis superciliosus]
MSTTSDSLASPTTWEDPEGDLPNCTVAEVGLKIFYLPIIYSIIFLVGFLGNVIAIGVHSFKMRPWKSSTIVMLNLAPTDLLYLTSLPFLIHYYASGQHRSLVNEFMCKLTCFSFYFNLYSSIFLLTCFSTFCYMICTWISSCRSKMKINFNVTLDRNTVIVHPMKFYRQRKRCSVVACAAIWVISLAPVSPVNFLTSSKEVQNRSLCSENLVKIRWYNRLLTGLAFFLPLFMVTLCYILIICTLATRPYTWARGKQKAHRLTIILLVVFYVCFLPIFWVAWVELWFCPSSCSLEKQIHTANVISWPLAALGTSAFQGLSGVNISSSLGAKIV